MAGPRKFREYPPFIVGLVNFLALVVPWRCRTITVVTLAMMIVLGYLHSSTVVEFAQTYQASQCSYPGTPGISSPFRKFGALTHSHRVTPFQLDDPYTRSGYLQFDIKDPLATRWISLTADIEDPPNWALFLRQAANAPYPFIEWQGPEPIFTFNPDDARYPLLGIDEEIREEIQSATLTMVDHLRRTTILLLGDSIDRNFVDQFAWLYQVEKHGKVSFNGEDFNASDIKTWGFPHYATVGADIDLTLANCFFYGVMDEEDEFETMHDWMPPGRAEDRIDRLFKPFADRLEHPPSLIQFHTGMWDLAYFGRQDRRTGGDSWTALSPERVAKWNERTSIVIQKVRDTWPDVPIVFRTIQRVGPGHYGSSEDFGGGTDFFTDVRMHQMRQMQIELARNEGLGLWDFGHVFEGYQQYQIKVHPHMWPGSMIMTQGLLHHAYLAEHIADYNVPRREPEP